MNNNEGTTWWALGLDNAKFESDVAKSNSLFRSIGNTAEKEGSRIDNIFRKITVAATGFFTAQQALGYAQKIAQVRGEYQQLEVAFNTMLGSKAKADALMTQLVNTAAKTPFDLVGVSSSAKQLLAYGIAADKVNDTLVRLGNIAAGLSIPLQDIAWLYGTTMTQGRLYAEDLNQFTGRGIPMIRELAKELGVAENEVKALVSEGKVGFPEVQKVIENLTNSGGMFYNLMEEQSNTITGKISNMEDAISVMFNEIGQANEGIINSILETGISAIENYEEIGKVIGDLVLMYGTYKAAIITISALQSLQASGIAALTAKEVIHYGWLVATQKAQLLLNRTIMANPYVAVAVAVAGIATAMWNFHDGITEAEKAQDRFNKKQKEAKEEEEEHKRKIDQLVESSRNIALSDLQRGHSLSELRKEYPKIFKQYDIESIKLADILKLKQQIAEEDSKRAVEKQANELSEIEKEITYYENLLESLSGQQGVDGYVKKLKELRADRDVLLQEKGKGISEQFISTLKDVDTKQLDLYMSVLEKEYLVRVRMVR